MSAEEMDGLLRSQVEHVGPFEAYEVVVNGWTVPFLQSRPRSGGVVSLTLDNRFAVDVSLADSERIIPFVADCIAVALGYTAHPGCDGLEDGPLPRLPFARMHSVELAVPERPGESEQT